MQCHMLFHIEMEDFRHEARLVAGGHMTKAPTIITYASIVSKVTVIIALIAALNDLEIKLGDIFKCVCSGTCLCFVFGKYTLRPAVIARALYGLKSAQETFRSHLARCMESLGYMSCMDDPDLWLTLETRPEDGAQYYS